MIWHLFICFSNTPGMQNGLGGLKDPFVKNLSWPLVSLLFFFKVTTIQKSKRLWVPRPWPWVHLSQPHWFRWLLFHTPLLPPRPIALLPLPWTMARPALVASGSGALSYMTLPGGSSSHSLFYTKTDDRFPRLSCSYPCQNSWPFKSCHRGPTPHEYFLPCVFHIP